MTWVAGGEADPRLSTTGALGSWRPVAITGQITVPQHVQCVLLLPALCGPSGWSNHSCAMFITVRALQVCGAQFVQVGLFGNPPKRRPDGKYFDDWLVTSTEIRTLNPCTSSEFYFHRAENVPFVERHNVPLQIRGAWDFVPCFHHFFQSRDCAD